jgi:hypothetical protein
MRLAHQMRRAVSLGAQDPYFSSVVLNVPFDQDFNDYSGFSKVPTVVGSAAISSQAAVGSGSLLLNGVNSWVSFPSSADFNFGTGDFTVEAFFRTSEHRAQAIFDRYQTGNSGTWYVFLRRKSAKNVFSIDWGSSNDVSVTLLASPDQIISDNTWRHVAVARQSGITRMFIQGSLVGEIADVRDYTTAANIPLALGAQITSRNSAYDLNGNIDAARLTKGVARYTEDFIPPTKPFPTQ